MNRPFSLSRGCSTNRHDSDATAKQATTRTTSTQTDPAEPGINHFNSSPDSSAWTFAAQVKAGARLALGDSGAYVFGEYRYLYVGNVNQVFGSTTYDTHVPTSPWTTSFGGTSHHLAAGGVGFSF